MPSIHLVRGSLAHEVLEDFFKIDKTILNDSTFEFVLETIIYDFFKTKWEKSLPSIIKLKLSPGEIIGYQTETREMMKSWVQNFLKKMRNEIAQGHSVQDSFDRLTPKCELELVSEKHGVRGFIDAIHEKDGIVKIVDYKTSKKDDLTDDYKLQLAIYAMLYHEKFGEKPHKVGINFLKFGEKYMDVDEELIKYAVLECELIHMNTATDEMLDYTKKPSGLCKWSSGQCDFYNTCIKDE